MMNLIDTIYTSIKYSTRDMILLPGHNLKNTLNYLYLIAFLSSLFAFLGLPVLVDWRGALVACVLMTLIVNIGRRDYNEVSGSNGNGDLPNGTDRFREETTNIEE